MVVITIRANFRLLWSYSHIVQATCVSLLILTENLLFIAQINLFCTFSKGAEIIGFFPKIQISGDQVIKMLFNPTNLDGT